MSSFAITRIEADRLTKADTPVFTFAHGDYYIKFFLVDPEHVVILQTIDNRGKLETQYILSSGLENSIARAWMTERLIKEAEEEEEAAQAAATKELTGQLAEAERKGLPLDPEQS